MPAKNFSWQEPNPTISSKMRSVNTKLNSKVPKYKTKLKTIELLALAAKIAFTYSLAKRWESAFHLHPGTKRKNFKNSMILDHREYRMNLTLSS